ncbi:hypothetical protein chiPu_0012868 [Chiloscyllium punctatum]|uniref:Elongator complex protein 4 n=1 Tax=Chiloscyllium punctatum TaxID=137246 RepID=A0A401SVH8_CHIPU|nr:hypothetical protein [Chiloscyllium punctatum]
MAGESSWDGTFWKARSWSNFEARLYMKTVGKKLIPPALGDAGLRPKSHETEVQLDPAIIFLPSTCGHLNKAIMDRVVKLSDTVIGLESFNVSERESNPLYKDYHGLLHVRQIPRLNSLICEVPDTKDLAFKLKRKMFTIERLHLPPDLSDTVSRSSKQNLAESAKLLSTGCGGAARGKEHLDF